MKHRRGQRNHEDQCGDRLIPEFAGRPLKVRQHRIPWKIEVPVGDAKPPGKDGKEKKGTKR